MIMFIMARKAKELINLVKYGSMIFPSNLRNKPKYIDKLTKMKSIKKSKNLRARINNPNSPLRVTSGHSVVYYPVYLYIYFYLLYLLHIHNFHLFPAHGIKPERYSFALSHGCQTMLPCPGSLSSSILTMGRNTKAGLRIFARKKQAKNTCLPIVS